MAPNNNLRQQRELRGWSQARLAEEIGTSAKIISRWERGIAFPSPYFRERLCTIFEQNAQELGLIPQTNQVEQEPGLIPQTNQVEQNLYRVPLEMPAFQEKYVNEIMVLSPFEEERRIPGHKVIITEPALPQIAQRQHLKWLLNPRWRAVSLSLFALLAVVIVISSVFISGALALQPSKPAQIAQTPQTPQTIDAFIQGKPPVLNDPLNAQNTMNWTNGRTNNGGTCTFENGVYHARSTSKRHITACYALNSNFSNGVFQVSMTLHGDLGGLLFRGDATSNSTYGFALLPAGFYGLFAYSDTISAIPLQTGSISLPLKPGQAIVISIVANKSNLAIYINKKYITTINNTIYQAGQIGVFASDLATTTDATFSNVKIWNL